MKNFEEHSKKHQHGHCHGKNENNIEYKKCECSSHSDKHEDNYEEGKKHHQDESNDGNPGENAYHGRHGLLAVFLLEGGGMEFLFLVFAQNALQLVGNLRALPDEGILAAVDLAIDVLVVFLHILPSRTQDVDYRIRVAQGFVVVRREGVVNDMVGRNDVLHRV